MLTIYTAPSCTSCKKAKTWLTYHNIPFQERNLIGDPLSAEEISRILEKCDDGVEGLISSRNRFGRLQKFRKPIKKENIPRHLRKCISGNLAEVSLIRPVSGNLQ